MAQSKDTASILKKIETIFNQAKQAPYHFTNIQKTLNEPVATLQGLVKQEPQF